MLLHNNFTRSYFSKPSSCIRLALLLACLSCPLQLQAKPFDWSLWNHILQHYLHSGTVDGINTMLIDYRSLKQDPDFYRIATMLKSYDPTSLDHKNKEAFYINSYNYFAVKLVIENWPVQSIQDIGIFFWPVWRHTAGYINGRKVTLNQIEHEILRPMGDPRIHFAINCASLSCPDLRNEAYDARQLDTQLDDQSRRFMNNPGKGAQSHDSKIWISAIFDWFEEDFVKANGSVRDFITQYSEISDDIKLARGGLPYNWSVNGE